MPNSFINVKAILTVFVSAKKSTLKTMRGDFHSILTLHCHISNSSCWHISRSFSKFSLLFQKLDNDFNYPGPYLLFPQLCL